LLLPSTWAYSLLFSARFMVYSGVDFPAEGEKTKQRRHLAKKIGAPRCSMAAIVRPQRISRKKLRAWTRELKFQDTKVEAAEEGTRTPTPLRVHGPELEPTSGRERSGSPLAKS
jgi:hypothetical protein